MEIKIIKAKNFLFHCPSLSHLNHRCGLNLIIVLFNKLLFNLITFIIYFILEQGCNCFFHITGDITCSVRFSFTNKKMNFFQCAFIFLIKIYQCICVLYTLLHILILF
nr:MAG TPA: hypothetical protein [Caudoviricetes sp.]